MPLNIASEDEIKKGMTADVYFQRTIDAFPHDLNDYVVAEFTANSREDKWIVFSGLDEVIEILKDRQVSLYALPEGTVIPPHDLRGVPVPFLRIHGRYRDFGMLETAVLGLICQSSGISTKTSQIKLAAQDKPVLSFGIRRMHPAIAPMIDRASYIGGADGVSGIMGARVIGIRPFGTMPHSLSIILGDKPAWELTLKNIGKDEPKVLLIDTFQDEKFSAIEVAEEFPDVQYIRLDTPSSRRGNFASLIREIRWELSIRGRDDIKIIVSGGLDQSDVKELRDVADAFGIGTSISSARPVNFAMDVVSVNGKAITKRGKFSGVKSVFRCPSCGSVRVLPEKSSPPKCECGRQMVSLLVNYLEQGKVVRSGESVVSIRERSLREMREFSPHYEVPSNSA